MASPRLLAAGVADRILERARQLIVRLTVRRPPPMRRAECLGHLPVSGRIAVVIGVDDDRDDEATAAGRDALSRARRPLAIP